MKNKKVKTECIFAVNGNIATCDKWDKEACANKSLNRGFAKCVYILSEDSAKETAEYLGVSRATVSKNLDKYKEIKNRYILISER